MFAKLLIANRGEIAVRIMRTARRLGLRVVAVYSDADAASLHVAMADEAWRIGPAPAAQSYLDQAAILEVALKSGAEAIHPGYGFLAENPDFAASVARAGLIFVGPPPEAIRAMGHKDEAKRIMAAAGVPLLPGYHGDAQDDATLELAAQAIGFPLLIKPVAGGGGKGMRRVSAPADLAAELAAARREAHSAFGDARVLLEKYLSRARHLEVQIMADAHGSVLHLFERDCSLQRRHQKIVEEAPAPNVTGRLRNRLASAAIAAARSVGYVGAGTVEFLADIAEGPDPDRIYFMEMNTRLQVEHPVTEMVTGLDLVELQLRVAAGETLAFSQDDVRLSGHAIEARLYAEDPARGFQPQGGRLKTLRFPPEPYLRVDAGVSEGDSVEPFYDPMIAKLIVHAPSRSEAVARLADVVARTRLSGCRTNLGFLSRLLRHQDVASGAVGTALVERDLELLVASPHPPVEAVAAALLHLGGYLAPVLDHSPFVVLRGFRLWGGEERSTTLMVGGRKVTASLTAADGRFLATCEGQSLGFRILSATEDALRLDFGDRVVKFTVTRDQETLSVTMAAERYEFLVPADETPEGSADGVGEIVSPVPGQLRDLLVKVGEVVERGRTVAILEAMKMEFSLKAERDGLVLAINAATGDQVAEGTVLIVIGDGNA